MPDTGAHLDHFGSAAGLDPSLGIGGLAAALLLAGFVGSFTHCAGMCGPFVLAQAQVSARPDQAPRAALSHLAGVARLPYHLGRLTTYVALGAGAAAFSGTLMQISGLRWLGFALLLLAALAFFGHAFKGFGSGLGIGARWASIVRSVNLDLFGRTIGRLARPLFARPVGWRGYGLGLALGFLPCGLLYGALAAAAASGSAPVGAAAMAAFALGTAPGLVAVGVTGRWAARRWPGLAPRLSAALMAASGVIVLVFAWRLVA